MTRTEAKEKLELLKAEIEWDYSLEYQMALDMAIDLLDKTSHSGDLIDAQKLYYKFGGSSQASMNPQLTVLEAPVIVKGESET